MMRAVHLALRAENKPLAIYGLVDAKLERLGAGGIRVIENCPSSSKEGRWGPLAYELMVSLFVGQSLLFNGGLHIPEAHLLVGFGCIL